MVIRAGAPERDSTIESESGIANLRFVTLKFFGFVQLAFEGVYAPEEVMAH